MTAATESPPRIATLDILRGVAVMGILAMNAVAFAMPEQAYFNPRAYGGADGADLIAWIASFILVDGKMRGLFSLLFGASTLLVIERAEAAGRSAAAAHYTRMLWLLVFGAIHFYLIWWGDILLHYAMFGFLLYLFKDAPIRTLGLWIAILLAVDLASMGGFAFAASQASHAASLPGASAEAVKAWTDMSSEFAPLSAKALAANLEAYRGGYAGILAYRIAEHGSLPLFTIMFGGPETLAYMLIGMAGLRSGFLTCEWDDAKYRRITLVALGVGIAGYAVLAALLVRANFDPATVIAVTFGGTVILRPLMILGYAALIILLTRRGGALVERIAAAGRAAFSNYLGTSILMTSLFYGYGLGLYGHVGRAELYLLVAAMWMLMLLWSKPWLDRYQYGPLEWLWRSLSRGRLQPMRKAAAA